MLTTMDVEVLELCTSTVTRIPTTSAATGLDRMALSLKMSPATFPREHEPALSETLQNPSLVPSPLPYLSPEASLGKEKFHLCTAVLASAQEAQRASQSR